MSNTITAKINPYIYIKNLNFFFLLSLSSVSKFGADCSRFEGTCYLNKTTSTLETTENILDLANYSVDVLFQIPVASYFDPCWTTAVAVQVLALLDNFVNMTSSTSIIKISLTPQQIAKKRQSSSEKKKIEFFNMFTVDF